MPNLIRTKDNKWRVAYIENRESKFKNFDVIEPAADFLNELGVEDDAIDEAIIAIYVYNGSYRTIAAQFDTGGNFSHLDGD